MLCNAMNWLFGVGGNRKKDIENDTYAIMLLAVLGLLFSIIYVSNSNLFASSSPAYREYFTCAKYGSFYEAGKVNCDRYPPLFIWLSRLFVFRQEAFNYFIIITFSIVIPLFIYLASEKEPISIWFYFSTSSLFFGIITGAYFAQALSIATILLMLATKNIIIRTGILLISILTHSYAFPIALFFYVLIAIEEGILAKNMPKMYSAIICSPFFGKVGGKLTKIILQTKYYTSGSVMPISILSLLLRRAPIFFVIPSLSYLLSNNKISLIGLTILFLIGGFTIHTRALHFIAFPMVIGLSWYFRHASKNIRLALILMSLIYFIINVLMLFRFINWCV